MEYLHLPTGIRGTFLREFENQYGDALLIKLTDGREFFAPKREFYKI